ncbi:MAG: orotidine-5'-phosphate decarboxylase [Bdellovibrionales bacterium]|nr:orotidine-5'-phosphate decarboxylase [Bdellovibrionales bacterium]
MGGFFKDIENQQKQKKTYLCVGLDPHIDKLPAGMAGDPNQVLPFLKNIVVATAPYVCAFKPQIAYFSAFGLEGALQDIIAYIHSQFPGIPVILDSKRGDIGSTAEMYAMEAFERYDADGVTVNPYMGEDSIEPFTRYKDRGIFALCRTSNEGAKELQNIHIADGKTYYRFVAEKLMQEWNPNHNVGLVVGATAESELRKLRDSFHEAWFLVPGVGAQGGDLRKVIQFGTRAEGGGLIVNSSRAILYASSGEDYAEAAGQAAETMQSEMATSFS